MKRRRRPLLSYGPVQRVIAGIRRNRAFLQPKPPKRCYLQIGCGWNPQPGFFNIDTDWVPGQQMVWDVRRRLPMADRSAAGLFTEHMLEHVTLAEALPILRDWHRVLAPGAVIRIVVPDGDLYFDRHRTGEPMPYADLDRREFPIYTPMVSINRIFRSHGHKFMFDFVTLAAALTASGFQDPVKQSVGVGRDPRLLIDKPSRAIESLYVEAIA